MKGQTAWALAACLAVLAATGVEAAGTGGAAVPKVKQVKLGIQHRVFPEFRPVVTTRMNERFPVGDTDYSGEIVQFIPHFDYDIKKRKAVSLSNELKNPAFRVIVREKGVPKDTSWVFLRSLPHFTRKSMLAFQVLRIDFVNHEPMVADTSTTRPAAK